MTRNGLGVICITAILFVSATASIAGSANSYIINYWKWASRGQAAFFRHGTGRLLTSILSPRLVPTSAELAAEVKTSDRFPASTPRPIGAARFDSDSFVVRVVTANLQLLPPPFALDHEARMDGFARIVRGRDPDLIILQEVWLERYLVGLRRRLPEYEVFAPRPRIGNPTGLAVFSRLPCADAAFRFYPVRLDFNLEEKLACKGFLAVEASIAGMPFWIVDTHLYAHKDDLELGITKAQFGILSDFCSGLAGPVILGGDMNMQSEILFPQLGGVFAVEPDGAGTTVRGGPGRRIDYVLTRSSPEWELTAHSSVVTEPVVSDHFPVFAEVTFRQKSR